jgi:hypothetical protein
MRNDKLKSIKVSKHNRCSINEDISASKLVPHLDAFPVTQILVLSSIIMCLIKFNACLRFNTYLLPNKSTVFK